MTRRAITSRTVYNTLTANLPFPAPAPLPFFRLPDTGKTKTAATGTTALTGRQSLEAERWRTPDLHKIERFDGGGSFRLYCSAIKIVDGRILPQAAAIGGSDRRIRWLDGVAPCALE
jgi:hypothetical protein